MKSAGMMGGVGERRVGETQTAAPSDEHTPTRVNLQLDSVLLKAPCLIFCIDAAGVTHTELPGPFQCNLQKHRPPAG